MRTFFLFFFFHFSPPLSFSASFPGSSSLAPFSRARPFSLSRSVLRNTHTLYRRSSVLERSTLYHRDAVSKIQPFFSRADQWALPLPLYPPVPTLAFFVILHSTGSKISYVSSLHVLSREQSLRPTSGGILARRCSLGREDPLSTEFGSLCFFLPWLSSCSVALIRLLF